MNFEFIQTALTASGHFAELVFQIISAVFFMTLSFGFLYILIKGDKTKKTDSLDRIDEMLNPKTPDFPVATSSKTLKDVAGIDPIVEDIQQVIDFIKHKDRYEALGAKLPKGILLVGQPGTGKTLIAKAIAGESQIKMISTSGSDFIEKYVGTGSARIRALFDQARKLNEPVIIFIDEIEVLGQDRSKIDASGSKEYHQTLNQLLTEMDGINSGDDQILILGATNLVDNLDKALLRPGRFDRTLNVPLPSKQGRLAILEVHATNKPLSGDVDLTRYAERTIGWSGAELANLINEAALAAANQNKPEVTTAHFSTAWERLTLGLVDRSRLLSPEERERVAFHEAGHALVAHHTGAGTVEVISIVPNTAQALGLTALTPTDAHLMTRQDVINQLATFFGGQVAEELLLGATTNGASDDIRKIKQFAEVAILQWGLTESRRVYLDEAEQKAEIATLIEQSQQTAMRILRDNLSTVKRIAETLLTIERLEHQEFLNLIHDFVGEEYA